MGIQDGFSSTRVVVKLALFVVFVAEVCKVFLSLPSSGGHLTLVGGKVKAAGAMCWSHIPYWIAFCTTSWFVSGRLHQGLWRTCDDTSMICVQADGLPIDKMEAVQAFAIFGFMSLNVGFLLIILFMFYGSCRSNSEVSMAGGIFLLFSAASWLISVAIFGDMVSSIDGLDFSYGLAVVALGLSLIGGLLMLIGGRGHTSTVTQ